MNDAIVENLDRQTSENRKNCLNTVRLFAAISVFYIHAITLLEVAMPEILTHFVSFFQGVPIFFAMSGFLVWGSVERSKNGLTYFKKRFLRIYPELWCAILVGSILILALYDAPIRWGQFGLFAVTQGTVLQFWTPDFLRGYGCGTPNGALWTIGVMVQFYIVIYFVHKWLRNKSLRAWIGIVVAAVAVAVLSPLLQRFLPEILYKLFRQTLIPYAWWFLLGTMVAAKSDILLPLLKKWCFPLLALSAVLMVSRLDVPMGDYQLFCSASLILGVIGFAYRFPKLNISVDISYGIYIYHMVVINAMITLGLTKSPLYVAISLLLTCLIAFASERTVGRLAMRLKK